MVVSSLDVIKLSLSSLFDIYSIIFFQFTSPFVIFSINFLFIFKFNHSLIYFNLFTFLIVALIGLLNNRNRKKKRDNE
ncbi:hypothetical protein C1645_791990 [Glomus cerebriforme]|uniref:Uncharacterized protein n=1 Tax=Glomus cerebriforme TaxID=658196 RepID=A0A397S2T3_9GLOM|nr:hypothetical protein C1645_791990 [Glomus cerebriforme]